MASPPNPRAPGPNGTHKKGAQTESPVPLPPPLRGRPPPPPAPAPPAPVRFPLSWLLEHAAAPIQYRAITEVARIGDQLGERTAALPYTYRPALMLALQQSVDGSWNRSMLALPNNRAENFEGVGTINAVRRLLEYGWDKDSPPLVHARRVLFRLLAEDTDPEFLYELGAKNQDED